MSLQGPKRSSSLKSACTTGPHRTPKKGHYLQNQETADLPDNIEEIVRYVLNKGTRENLSKKTEISNLPVRVQSNGHKMLCGFERRVSSVRT